jgi:hypothetical protein
LLYDIGLGGSYLLVGFVIRQVFLGGDHSGATMHWHYAALYVGIIME